MNGMFSKELYSKIALLKASYAFTDKVYFHLDANEKYYIVETMPKQQQEDITKEEFENELLVQGLRHEINTQTKTIREMMIARAIASSSIEIQSETEPVLEDTEYTEENIIKDWFDEKNT